MSKRAILLADRLYRESTKGLPIFDAIRAAAEEAEELAVAQIENVKAKHPTGSDIARALTEAVIRIQEAT